MTTEQPNYIVQDLEIMQEAERYRRWTIQPIRHYIGRRILEVGAGIGNMTEMLLDLEPELVMALEVDTDARQALARRFAGRAALSVSGCDISAPDGDAMVRHGFDTAVCYNVLEHIEDDRAALAGMYRAIDAGGHLLLMVPALRMLYGTIDMAVGHHRRYARSELVEKTTAAGFRIRKLIWFNFPGLAAWFWNNRVLKRPLQSRQQVRFFDRAVVPVVSIMERLVPPPIGMSLIAACQKPPA